MILKVDQVKQAEPRVNYHGSYTGSYSEADSERYATHLSDPPT